MYSKVSGPVDKGAIDLSHVNFNRGDLVVLSGQWEFYWDRLLTQENFMNESKLLPDSYINVPGSWHVSQLGVKSYPEHGVATYRLHITYPVTLKDPALRIQRVSSSFKLYVNGEIIKEVGKVSDQQSDFKGGYEQVIVALPNDKQELDLIIQVANFDYARGGLRESPIFASKQALENHKMTLLVLQVFFIGCVCAFGFYYLLLFILQRKNRTALLFSILCFITAFHSLMWGETPLMILFQSMTTRTGIIIVYLTSCNIIPIMILFILSIYPKDYSKRFLVILLLPNLFFNALQLTSVEFMTSMNIYFFLFELIEMIYIVGVLMKAFLRKRENSLLMLITIGVFVLSILADIFNNVGIGRINLTYMTLFGNATVIIAMSYIQAKKQANTHQKLVLYNENLIEASRLKDKVMETEMSFLQAQIKPHFLYNALNAIANVCEKDGRKASKLILDLAIYLRGSLEFNNLDKLVTVEKELEFVDTYFNIEQARFGLKIQLQKDIEVPYEYQLPVLILQPLVENAVRHGISKKPEGGVVYLRIKKINDEIHIEIEDNGVGMDDDKLNMLLLNEGGGHGVGLLNINNRLNRLFGKGLKISSELGRGTLVKLVLSDRRKQV
jgi:sensor histidine kinase YesM